MARDSKGDACIHQSTHHDPQTQWHTEHRLYQEHIQESLAASKCRTQPAKC